MQELRHVFRWFVLLSLGVAGAYGFIVLVGTVATYGLAALRQLLR